MIITSRDKANLLISDKKNLLRDDSRNTIPGETNIEERELYHGKPHGRTNLTDGERQIIATEVLVSGKTYEEIAAEYGVSPDSVAAYANGATSCATYNKKDPALEEHIVKVKDVITAQAQNKLLTAIQSLTDDKIGLSKARDISAIAKDMSTVMKNMGPEMTYNDNRKVILYKPRQREEDEYEVIDVSS